MAVIKTFSTDEVIYKDFKKTCVDNEESISQVLTEFMRKYLKESKTPTSEKLEERLKESNSDGLDFFADPELWIEYFSSFTEEDMKKASHRLEFFKWLYLIQLEKLQKELGRNLISAPIFDSSKEAKALKHKKLRHEYEAFAKRSEPIYKMYDPLSPYYKPPKI